MSFNGGLGVEAEVVASERYSVSDYVFLENGKIGYARFQQHPPESLNSEISDPCVLMPSIAECRQIIADEKARKLFWKDNIGSFERSVRSIMDHFPKPKGWEVFVAIGDLQDGRIWPFEYSSFSLATIVGATPNQGYEMLAFFNRARGEFLSQPALIPLLAHEYKHIKQIAKAPKKYHMSVFDDDASLKIEKEAEDSLKELPLEVRREAVLESIVYCHDIGGFTAARKMAEFLHQDVLNLYGGGYNQDMSDHEFSVFEEAEKANQIGRFIRIF